MTLESGRAYNRIQENPEDIRLSSVEARSRGDELNPERHSSLGMKPRRCVGGECHNKGGESLFGLPLRLIDRLSPIVPYRVHYSNDVTVYWDRQGGFNGGIIVFAFGEEIDESFGVCGRKPLMIFTSLEVYRPHNPFEGVSAILTVIANINRAACLSNKPLKHMVRANHFSGPVFEKMRKEGLYAYCTLEGTVTEKPLYGPDYKLYLGVYPQRGLAEVLGKFVIPKAARGLADLYVRLWKEQK